jgi:hypothetical protein
VFQGRTPSGGTGHPRAAPPLSAWKWPVSSAGIATISAGRASLTRKPPAPAMRVKLCMVQVTPFPPERTMNFVCQSLHAGLWKATRYALRAPEFSHESRARFHELADGVPGRLPLMIGWRSPGFNRE